MRYLLALLLLVSPAYAQVRIARKNRVDNIGPCCVWASLETIGKHRKDYRLSGLVDWYSKHGGRHGANNDDIRACLDRREIKYRILTNMTLEDLRAKVDVGIPVMISIPGHAIVAVDVKGFDDGVWIKTVDPNWTDNYTWYKESAWENWGVVIED